MGIPLFSEKKVCLILDRRDRLFVFNKTLICDAHSLVARPWWKQTEVSELSRLSILMSLVYIRISHSGKKATLTVLLKIQTNQITTTFLHRTKMF